VSCPAGYPIFSDLVEYIYEAVPSHKRGKREQGALDRKEYDRALHIFESSLQGDKREVRAATIERLSKRPRTLGIHEALLCIAKQADGVHLVTTNFDNLFEKALRKLKYKSTEVDAAPTLPVPKPKKWDSVVHLHGLVNKSADPDGRRLVLTSADFGSSYLTERWASRFITELVSRYTILFVGYNADDAVMRYILDALHTEIQRGERVYPPFAFAGYDSGKREEVVGEWKAKGVKAIAYPKVDKKHLVLEALLTNWASDWEDGRQGKSSIVDSLAPSNPPLPSDEKEKLLWALADPSGIPASRLTTLDTNGALQPLAPLSWVDDFFEAGLLSARSIDQEEGVEDRLFGVRDTEHGMPLSKRDRQFCSWLCTHLPNLDLYRQVAAAGGSLHPDLALRIRGEVVEKQLSAGYADLSAAWSVVTSPAIVLPPSQEMPFKAVEATCLAIDRWESAPWIDNDIEHALTPFLRIQDPEGKWAYEPALGLTAADRTTQDYLSADLTLRCGDLGDLLAEKLRGKEDLLVRLATRATSLLRRALDLYAIVSNQDPSWLGVSRIGGLASSSRGQTWAVLVDLVWSAFLACEDKAPDEASATYEAWVRSPYPAHRRLAIRAAAVSKILTPAQRMSALVG